MYIQVINNTNVGNHMADDGKFDFTFPISSSSFLLFFQKFIKNLIRNSPFGFF